MDRAVYLEVSGHVNALWLRGPKILCRPVSLLHAVCRNCADDVVMFDNCLKISLFCNEHKRSFQVLMMFIYIVKMMKI